MSFRNQRGQGLIEYIILVALVAVACIGFVRTFQKNLQVQLANVTNAISGKKIADHEGKTITGEIKRKDFGNFMNGAASGGKESREDD